jgi:hypothetical protein
MGQYDDLDKKILQRLKAKPGCIRGGFCTLVIRTEVNYLVEKTGREACRIIDGRLQALRKKELINFSIRSGWALTGGRE